MKRFLFYCKKCDFEYSGGSEEPCCCSSCGTVNECCYVKEIEEEGERIMRDFTPEENCTIEQNCGENRVEGGVLSISGSAKVYTCKDCLRYQFCYLAQKRNNKACLKISLYEETEKHCRPFEDTAELMVHYSKHFNIDFPPFYEPIIWIKKKVCSGDERSLITAYDINCVFIQDVWIDMTELFEKYTFLDGSVCGVENEIQF